MFAYCRYFFLGGLAAGIMLSLITFSEEWPESMNPTNTGLIWLAICFFYGIFSWEKNEGSTFWQYASNALATGVGVFIAFFAWELWV